MATQTKTKVRYFARFQCDFLKIIGPGEGSCSKKTIVRQLVGKYSVVVSVRIDV